MHYVIEDNQPVVSIGLPVFNGEDYIEETIRHILDQSYPDFELIITDNASTDKTREICLDYASRDQRIKYYRSQSNLGAIGNFNWCFLLSHGKYFKWAAHDDLLLPDYLLSCIEVLERESSIVLCHAKTKVISPTGACLQYYDVSLPDAASSRPQNRFGTVILVDHLNYVFFGVIRSIALRNTPLLLTHIGSDKTLVAELALMGKFYEIPEFFFLSRDHPARSMRAFADVRDRGLWFDPRNSGKRNFPHWRMLWEYYQCVKRSSLNAGERRGCYLKLLKWLGVSLNWGRLIEDICVATVPASKTGFLNLRSLLKQYGLLRAPASLPDTFLK